MSILTSDGKRKTSQLIRAAIKYSNLLSIVLYLAGFIVFAYFINDGDKTYFSDNALSPGLANREFKDSKTTDKYLKELETLTQNNDDIPIDYLYGKFQKFGLEFYEQNFTLNYPFDNSKYTGKNVYAIHRAARASSTEAIVISTPFRNSRNRHGTTLPSVAIILSLAEKLSELNYWAKDLIFLIGNHELVGIQAWLNAYHGLEPSPFMYHSKLSSQSGIIQAALNLEISSLTPRSLELKLVGINGQTPNLDLFNVAVELCQRESIPATFNGQSYSYSPDPYDNFMKAFRSTAIMMLDQASGLPNGAHGLFQKFAIASLTIETLPNRLKSSTISSSNIVRSIEGVIRSVNNMQQQFHRSFFFYLLPSPRRYISIGFYMIPFALAALPLPLRALNYYFRFCDSSNDENSNIWDAYNSLFIGQLYGIVVLSIPVLFSRIDISKLFPIGDLSNSDLMILSLGVVSLFGLFCGQIKNKHRKPASEWYLEAMITLIHLSLLLSAFAVLNFSFGYLLCLIYVPFIFIIQALQHYNSRHTIRLVQNILLLLIHPICLHFLCLLIYSVYQLDDKEFFKNYRKHLSRSIYGQLKTSLFYIEDWFLYDNWTFVGVCIGIMPAWIQLWLNSNSILE